MNMIKDYVKLTVEQAININRCIARVMPELEILVHQGDIEESLVQELQICADLLEVLLGETH